MLVGFADVGGEGVPPFIARIAALPFTVAGVSATAAIATRPVDTGPAITRPAPVATPVQRLAIPVQRLVATVDVPLLRVELAPVLSCTADHALLASGRTAIARAGMVTAVTRTRLPSATRGRMCIPPIPIRTAIPATPTTQPILSDIVTNAGVVRLI